MTTSWGRIDYIRSRLNDAELLAGLAEEASELSAAALKLRRAMEGSNPTPVDGEQAEAYLVCEIADVINYLAALRMVESITFDCSIYPFAAAALEEKMRRWVERLSGESHD